MNDRLLLLGRMLVVFVGAWVAASCAHAQNKCPEKPVALDSHAIKLKSDAIVANGVLVRQPKNSNDRFGTTYVATKRNHSDRDAWTTDCDVFLKPEVVVEPEECPLRDMIKDHDRMRITSAGVNAYALSLWRPNKPNPGSLDDYDGLLDGVPLTPMPASGERIDWLQGQVGNITYYVLLGETRNVNQTRGIKYYIVEIFHNDQRTCSKFRPESVKQPDCRNCKFWPGPLSSDESVPFIRNPPTFYRFEADVGGGHEPPRRY